VAKTLLTGRMESHLVSSDATTESQDTDSSDELTEVAAAETSPSVSGSPGVRMGVSGNAIPVPEVEPEDLRLTHYTAAQPQRLIFLQQKYCRMVQRVIIQPSPPSPAARGWANSTRG